MTLRFSILIFLIGFSAIAKANTGCSTYNGLYPNSLNSTNALTGNPYYDNSNYIAYRYYDQDPNCGIKSTRITNYSPITYCDVKGVRTYGMLVVYNPADNSCMQLPLDDLIVPLMGISGGFACWRLKYSVKA